MKRTLLAGCAVSLGAFALPALAADHIDSPAAVADPAADITDLYAWMTSDAEKLNMILNVSPFATEETAFSPAVQYVFHMNSSAGYGEAQTESTVICQFATAAEIECWGAGTYVSGDPSNPEGLVSDDGALRVFAGLRDDPFFLEFQGLTATIDAVVSAAPDLEFDDDGCPELSSEVGSALRTQLASGMDGAPASDTFAGSNVLSLVVQVDKTRVTSGGPLLGVWASTHRN